MKSDSARISQEEQEAIFESAFAQMKAAVREALLDHKRAGNPIATWRDGQVVWIAPEDIEVEPE